MNDRVPTINDDLPVDKNPVDNDEGNYYAGIARKAWDDSTDFFDKSIRERIEKNYALAASKHPKGSKYHTDKYKHRSKSFRGKTKAAIRKNNAGATQALFSTDNVLAITATNQDDEQQVHSSEMLKEVVNYRLSEEDMQWFRVCIGAYSEAQKAGFVISKHYWEFKEDEVESAVGLEQPLTKAVIDRPKVELLPPENCRLSANADWLDPVNSSPYFIVAIPMYAGDIQARMKDDWHEYSDGALKSAMSDDTTYDTTAQARTGQDTKIEETTSINIFDVIWVRENFMRLDGEEVVYFTMGQYLLSDPVPLEEAYPHCDDGRRPIQFGVCSIDPHRVYAEGLPERVESDQIQINTLSNQRFDNIELALNGRRYIMRNKGVDMLALQRSVPGGGVMMDDINAVKQEETRDVTSSSSNEQNILNMGFDELAGTFSTSSVGSSRQLGETVGGMNIMSGNSNTLSEYQLQVFVKSWVHPTLRRVVRMVQVYESDESIQDITGNQQLRSIDINVNAKIEVDVGFGATDPTTRVQKLTMGLSTIAKLGVEEIRNLDGEAVISEVFGSLGYGSGQRFFKDKKEGQPTPEMQQVMEENKQLKQMLETKQVEMQGKEKIEQIKSATTLRKEDMSNKSDIFEKQLEINAEGQLKMGQWAVDQDMNLKDLQTKVGIHSDKFALDTMEALNRKMEAQTMEKELNYKMLTGHEGI